MSRFLQFARLAIIAVLLVGIGFSAALAQGSGRIRGQVVDEDDNPIAGVALKAESSGSQRVLEATTDDDGRFSMIGFNTGQWTFSASAEGYQPATNTGRVSQGENSPLNIVMERIRHGLVLALGEEALEGVDPTVLEEEIKSADAEYNAEIWDAAIAGYNHVLKQVPQLSVLYLYIGNAHRASGAYEEALASYEQLLAADPAHPTAKAEIARTKMAMGDFDAAAAELEAAASGLDASREDLYNLGELEFAQGEMDAATQWYERAATVDPAWGKPPFKLALVALNQGDMATAKQYFEKVLEVDPDSEEGAQAKTTLAALP